MAGTAPAASSAVVTGACSHPIQFVSKRRPLRLSLLRSRFYHHLSARPRLQESCRPWISAVSEMVVESASNAAPVAVRKPEISQEEAPQDSPTTTKEATISQKEAPQDSPTTTKEATISTVMADVANLIKLVDTRDIVELELKHEDYELVIKKKEALAPPPAISPQVISAQMVQAPIYSPPPPVAPAPSPAATPPVPANAPPPAPQAQPVASLPRILCPMAGTLYKCPAPGEPPFVKVGDKVSKGQVICIVEAMKLMNEIEADQSGTIVEILAEDGKPVAVDTPLFAIKP